MMQENIRQELENDSEQKPNPLSSGKWAIIRYALERATEKNLTQVASSLTFTTVLSIVPLLAVVLSLFTAFPLFAEFRIALEEFLTGSLMPPAVSDNVMVYLNDFAAKASSLTAVGSLFLIVTSVMLIKTIDESFNDIWQIERQRPMIQRMLMYWAIISLGPILTGASLWATSVVARESLDYMDSFEEVGRLGLSFIPLIATGLGFTGLFMLVPNRKVEWRDALMGGLGTALVLEIMRSGFTFYLTTFPSYTLIYGAFAIIPIFLLWLYLSWLVILIGATLASILPLLRQKRWETCRYTGDRIVTALRLLDALWEAQKNHVSGRSLPALCSLLHQYPDDIEPILHELKQLGLVVNTDATDMDLWVLACDQRSASLTPLIHAMLIDAKQPELAIHPRYLRAISQSLQGHPVPLHTLFDAQETRP